MRISGPGNGGALHTFVENEGGVDIEWDKANSMRKNFIVDDTGIVPHVDVFDCNCWNL